MMKHLALVALLISGSAFAKGEQKFQKAVWVTHPNGEEMVCFGIGQPPLLACSFQRPLKEGVFFKCAAGKIRKSEYVICEPGI